MSQRKQRACPLLVTGFIKAFSAITLSACMLCFKVVSAGVHLEARVSIRSHFGQSE